MIAAVRASEKVSVSAGASQRQRLAIVVFAAGAWLIALVTGVAVSKQLATPLQTVRDVAALLGHGDFNARAPRSKIKEIDEVGTALAETALRLDLLVARERAFSAQASHQLRTPLTSLRLAIEAELAAPRSHPELALVEVLHETDRLETTIADLLALARDDHQRDAVDPVRVAKVAHDRWKRRLQVAGRDIVIRTESDIESVRASAIALGQILDVLCDNALKHGAGPVVLSVRHGRGGGTVIGVHDDGLGMNKDPFDHASGEVSGMGLRIASALAANEDARLRLVQTGPCPTFEVVLR